MTATPTTFSQDIANFAEGFLGYKPLFSNGVQIGNWQAGGGYFDLNAQDVLSNVCNQIVSLNAGVTAAQMDPTTWTTTDDFGQAISVQNYCLQKSILPSWMTQADLVNYVQQPSGAIVPQTPSSLIVPLAVGGGLILLSILLLARR